MADVDLDPLHPIQLGHVGIHHPFDEVVLHGAERGALLVPQILEILKSLHFAFPPEGYRPEKHRLSGAEYNRALNAASVFSVTTTLFLDCNPCSDYVRLMNKGKSDFQVWYIGKALDGQTGQPGSRAFIE